MAIIFEKTVYDISGLNLPTICPSCGSDLIVLDNGMVKCANAECSGSALHLNLYFFTKLDIKGAGNAFIEASSKEWHSVSDILKAWKSPNRSETFCRLAGGINGNKIIAEMDKKIKPMSMSFFLNLFDFDGFGFKKISLLEDTPVFKEAYDGFLAPLFEKPIDAKIKGLSSESLKDFHEQLSDKSQDILESYAILSGLIFKENSSVSTSEKFAGMNFCFTGACECGWKRKECEAKVIELGGKVTAVNKDLTYLVTDDVDSGSTKAKKAKELGSKVITSFEFKAICEA